MAATHPWRPAALRENGTEGLAYVCIEDVMLGRRNHPDPAQDLVTLVIAAWPGEDPQGRLHFDGGELAVVVSVAELYRFLRSAGIRRGGSAREVQRGDVFAMRMRGPLNGLDDAPERLDTIFGTPVADISREARQKAYEALQRSFGPKPPSSERGLG